MTEKQKKYIFVAEDDTFYLNIYQSKLEKEGYEVGIAKNGQQTIEEIKKRKPDLLLLDLVMPIKDGFEVLKEIHDNVTLKGIKVIVVSNLGQEEDVKKAKELGAVDYIIKANMSITQIMEKIKSHI
ncbi:MAG TPA: response regulator [Patescibacteria group bacterium]